MKAKELKEPCKSAIAKGRCLGCTGLTEEDWIEPKKCPNLPETQEVIEQIFINLGVDRRK